MSNELAWLSLTELSRRLAAREISSSEVVDACLARIAALDSRLHAFVDVYAQSESGEDVRLHCYTTWDTPEQLEAFLERGYTVERMLRDIAGIQPDTTLLMEKIF